MQDIAEVNVALRVHMTKEEAEKFNFPENFYEGFVIPHLGLNPEDENFKCDCKEISVSQELFDFWSNLYYEKNRRDKEARSAFNMVWLCYGPTTDEALHGFEICASDKFVIIKKEETENG